MSEISKITEKIAQNAADYEAEEIAKAKKRAAEIFNAYKAEAEQKKKTSIEKGKKNAATILAKGEAAAVFIRKNTVLQMKSALIDDVMKSAAERIASMPKEKMDEYYAEILLLAASDANFANSETCEVSFNAHDRERLASTKFLQGMSKKAAAKGIKTSFKLSNRTADIRNGFILRCGDIEINCSIDKMIEEQRPVVEAQVAKILFGNK